MILSREAVREYQELCKQHYCEELTDEQAEREALELIRLVGSIQPLAQLDDVE